MDLKSRIREIPDFPQKGVLFRDITPLLKDPQAFRYAVDSFADRFRGLGVDAVLGIEARGYVFGAPLAYALGAEFVIVRKLGKLPWLTVKVEYALEYGTSALEMHKDALDPGQRVVIVDDLLATGGTAQAAVNLVEGVGAQVAGLAFVVELAGLKGREKLKGYPITSLVTYD